MSGKRRVLAAGDKFGRLTIIEPPAKGSKKTLVRCDCGTVKTVTAWYLGKSVNSCGCLRRENTASLKLSHGQASTKVYNVWADMIARCNRPTHPAYANYGGRGITVCDRWRSSFAAFIEDMGPRPDGEEHGRALWSIDRIDSDGPYSTDNCRWTDNSTQAKNRRSMGGSGVRDSATGQFAKAAS